MLSIYYSREVFFKFKTREKLFKKSFKIVILFCYLFFGSIDPGNAGNTDSDMDLINSTVLRNAKIHASENLIPPDYSIHIPPPTLNNQPTEVQFSVLIINVRDILEIQERIVLEMNLRMIWQDTRMRHLNHEIQENQEFLILNPVLIEKIWHPDVFIDRVKSISSQELISKPHSLRYYPDGVFRYSSRITIELSCPMDFHYYPADTQRCYIDMKSYAYADNILEFNWGEGKGAALVDDLSLHNFGTCIETTDDFMVHTPSGNYSGIRFAIVLRRRLNYHLIQTYIPSFLFIVVSWLSFLVPPESVPGRIAMTMMTLLTLTAMFASVRQNTPNVSYIKALDIWMVFCIFFVFLSLVEYAILLKLKGKLPKMVVKKKKTPRPYLMARNYRSTSHSNSIPITDNDDLVNMSTTTTFSGPGTHVKVIGRSEPILTRLNKFINNDEPTILKINQQNQQQETITISDQVFVDDSPNLTQQTPQSAPVILSNNSNHNHHNFYQNQNSNHNHYNNGNKNLSNLAPPQPPTQFLIIPPSPKGLSRRSSAVSLSVQPNEHSLGLARHNSQVSISNFKPRVENSIQRKVSQVSISNFKPRLENPIQRKVSQVSMGNFKPRLDPQTTQRRLSIISNKSSIGQAANVQANQQQKKEEEKENMVNKYNLYIRRIERSTWVIVPTLFFVFNLVYWPWLLSKISIIFHKVTYLSVHLTLE